MFNVRRHQFPDLTLPTHIKRLLGLHQDLSSVPRLAGNYYEKLYKIALFYIFFRPEIRLAVISVKEGVICVIKLLSLLFFEELHHR